MSQLAGQVLTSSGGGLGAGARARAGAQARPAPPVGVWLFRALIFSEVVLASVYLVSQKFTVARILEVMIVGVVFLLGVGNRSVRDSTRRLLVWAFGLIAYKFVLDSTIHSDGTLQPAFTFLIESFVVLMLPALERVGEDHVAVVKAVLIAVVPACLLGVLQALDPKYELWRLVPPSSLIVFEARRFDYLEETGRIVGTYRNAIGFALVVGIGAILVWAKGLVGMGGARRIGAALAFVGMWALLVLSQTRSAIYGLLPSMVVGYVVASRHVTRAALLLAGTVVVGTVGLASFQALVSRYSERSVLTVDASTYYKITANLYGTYAALRVNPMIGVPVNRDLDRLGPNAVDQELVRKGRQALGNVLELPEEYRLVATNHNLLAFYLKYYGLIGFGLLVGVMYAMFRKAINKRGAPERYAVMGTFVYFVQFSLLHNTQLLETLLLWVLLAHGEENGRDRDLGRDGDLQRRGVASGVH